MKLIQVDPTELQNLRETHRGRVSYPLLKMFMEGGHVCDRIDRAGMQQSTQSLSGSINSYIRAHKLPVKLFSVKGQLYLLRLDLNDDGTPNPDYEPPGTMYVREPLPEASEELHAREGELEVVDAAAARKRSGK